MSEKSNLTKQWEKSDEYDNAYTAYLRRVRGASSDFHLSREFANGRHLFRKRINQNGDGNSG